MKSGAVISCVAVLLLAGCSYFQPETAAEKEQPVAVSAAQPATITSGGGTSSDASLSNPPPMATAPAAAAPAMSAATATTTAATPAATATPAPQPATGKALGDSDAKAAPHWKMHIDERPLICNNNGADSCDDTMHR